uniref:Si:ch73-379j16.2 n=1 Tax=Seriola dumerili TaxID=41447 RepID=A0A3B4U4J2_SERDU
VLGFVEITDVNDHSPAFPEKEQTFEIAEHTLPGKRFQLHTARDPDAGINSIRTYTLTSNEHFEVNIRQSDAGKIPFLVLKKSLDREQKNKHALLVTAVDGGKPPRTGTLNVSIIVLDSNDNRPIFSQEIYQTELQENVLVGTFVFRMNATDPDEDTNGQIEYSFGKTLRREVYDIFVLDKLTGEIRVKGVVDYEENDLYELDVEASDKGTPPLTGECRVIVKIKDVNDNLPEIEVTSLSNTVSEDSKPGTAISLLSVRDKDSGVNGKTISHIVNDVPFELKPSYKENTYSVVTKDFLDREQVSHTLLLTAQDGGKPPKSGTMEILIDVLDVNDNAPVFIKDVYSAEINENSPLGTIVIRVNATDLDEGLNGEVSYSFGNVNSKVRKLFDVDPTTGEITVKGQLDHEVDDSYEIDIQASDSGAVPFRTDKSVSVNIKDINDNAPVIDVTSLSNKISEDSRPGTTVALLSITDLDSGVNGKVISFVKGDVPFTLTPSIQDNMYAVVTKTQLDRENKSIYDVTVIAKDAGEPALTSEKTLRVAVSDVNDNSPEFSMRRYNFYVTENNPPGVSVFSLIASDCDEGANALLSYNILREGNEDSKVTSFLNINSENGDILALKSFDFETLKTFKFHVVASDSGTPSLSSNVTVNVFILDQNDNAPVILYPLSSNGSAEDHDEGDNSLGQLSIDCRCPWCLSKS